MPKKYCRKFEPPEYGARVLPTTDRRQTTDGRQTDGRQHIANVNVFAKNLLRRRTKALHQQHHTYTICLKQQQLFLQSSTCNVHVIIIRSHRSTTYVDAAYSYRPSSVVCRSVGLSVGLSVTLVSPAKTAAPIELPFGLRTWVGLGNHVLDGRPDPPMGRGKNFGGEWASHCKV